MEKYLQNQKIIVFDGICVLCNRSVDFLLKHDRKKKLLFVSLQSETAQKLLNLNKYQSVADSIIFLDEGKIFEKSTAVIRIAIHLGFPYSMISFFYVIPQRIRDLIYDHIARNRFRWFGKKESCRIPDDEIRHRFLDESDF